MVRAGGWSSTSSNSIWGERQGSKSTSLKCERLKIAHHYWKARSEASYGSKSVLESADRCWWESPRQQIFPEQFRINLYPTLAINWNVISASNRNRNKQPTWSSSWCWHYRLIGYQGQKQTRGCKQSVKQWEFWGKELTSNLQVLNTRNCWQKTDRCHEWSQCYEKLFNENDKKVSWKTKIIITYRLTLAAQWHNAVA